MELIEEKQNSLLNRKELKLNISELESLPSMDAAKKMVSENFSVPEENIHIDRIAGKFGSKGFTISANIYNSGSEREKFHVIKKKQKGEGTAK
jgi:small subunit ribosomal protein S24e